jgi:hypothetical protein
MQFVDLRAYVCKYAFMLNVDMCSLCIYIYIYIYTLSRVSVTKTRFWTGESVYWIFTIRNYNQFLHSQDYWNYSTGSVIHYVLSFFFWPRRCSLETLVLKWSQFSYPLGTDNAQKTQFYCCTAQTTQKESHLITIFACPLRLDCCQATSYKHLSYCCVNLSEVFIAPLLSYTRYNMYVCAYFVCTCVKYACMNVCMHVGLYICVSLYILLSIWVDCTFAQCTLLTIGNSYLSCSLIVIDYAELK